MRISGLSIVGNPCKRWKCLDQLGSTPQYMTRAELNVSIIPFQNPNSLAEYGFASAQCWICPLRQLVSS